MHVAQRLDHAGQEDAQRLDKALNTGNVLSSFLPGKDDVAVADYFEAALQLERQATVIREFALSFVPGILQTEAYARAVLRVGFPPLSEEGRDRLVVTRLERSQILSNPVTPVVWVLLDEAVLRRPAGNSGIMADQLTHIVRLVETERVRVHVMPFGMGIHPLMQSMLTLMWFEDQPPVAYSEGLRIGKVHDAPNIVERLQGAYDLALGDALPLRESLALIRAATKEHEHHG
ncbi:DUF5753 domain-containing protein [Streptomyces sp. NPDC056921]|uniref:DUF5753 domain-containing protein n=1 Tax=Streptomyces sp. NPDC056921 TaxID=3345966 RepID=UPI00363A7BB3